MLKVENLQVSYGKVQAIYDVSFQVHKGEIVTIIGSNGAGKSTILKTVVGLLRGTAGRIMLDGEEITKKSSAALVRSGVRLVPEGRQIFPGHTVYENLLLGGYVEGDKRLVNRRIQQMYEMFPILSDRKHQLGGTLSGGEQQMLAIARALITTPKLLILDEPSLGLAPIIVQDIFALLNRLCAEGITILLVEQMAAMALEISDRAYVLEIGKIVMEGSGKEISSSEEILRAYLG
ncbi:ABC transporter ATP-binding protein [Desulfosporosinus sp. PR]|uniref:ABC transporter ATP-binding protein n=1 Tax=Candidatus Desulfosporosinus nitrosoreducens TaxID=3401928 RepID=UPI0027EB2966|nr:ABC transporter ATP-binding protein [Desulfosporosinus sp. PR]MDQ7093233.1 ABC transporter ATP-binding protein [Desulfosporosinus sp. PR]